MHSTEHETEGTWKNTKGTEHPVRNMAEAKEAAIRMLDSGKRYREVAKHRFLIGGKVHRFSISQLSRFRAQGEGEEGTLELSQDGSPGAIASKVFARFQK